MRKVNILFISSSCFLFSGCGPKPEEIIATMNSAIQSTIFAYTKIPSNTPHPTYTLYPTNTAQNTFTPYATYTIYPTNTAWVVTPTLTYTASKIPTKTKIPSATPKPTKTRQPNPLTDDHFSGIFAVRIDIAPGRWQITEPLLLLGGSDCYWARYNAIGNVIEDMYGDLAGTIITVKSSDTLVEFDRCGRMVYLGP